MKIAIVGGGLGGLTAALLLRQAGVDAVVYEQTAELREVGAGIVVGPNMARPLARAGLGEELASFAVPLDAAWEFRRWEDGRVLFSQPMGEECRRLYGIDCYVAHRADMLAMLLRALPAEAVRTDRRLETLHQDGEQVELVFTDSRGEKTTATADAVIGADGIHSTVRPLLVEEEKPRFSGLCAYRLLVDAEQAPELVLRRVQTLWLGPGRHFVHYPIRDKKLVNIVATVPAGDWRIESWTAEGRIEDLAREFETWDPRVRELIASADSTKRWALYDRSPLPRWTDGRVTLLGDAAHSMVPYFGQGAAQAVEDAAVLAGCLREATRDTVGAALLRYEEIRRPRATQVQLMSRGREVQNHLPDGPEQVERDAALIDGDPLRQNAWLYGYDTEEALAG
ncbi:salicylate hydroxylase [Streptosporangium becharense]|uniref:Salicylate hydroxylase n=1 Tax=Streptosporangium becharense TaxID=1816182 RepID=A0A7W9INC0_9ACTN|nr:FAD-dependent monooxygenase [Streptosporangium becharense]MBB2914433.1 salicylate hydroxylase [Streptosporangium becharense]MBB5823535.1 salicylate hydroxylase [Streptosporangium becharense]